jgi:hypothetical protein
MYQVDYITNHVNGMVESGCAIILADSQVLAIDLIERELNLPPSRTRCEVAKIKPPVYKVKSRQSYPAADKKPQMRAFSDASDMRHFHVLIEVTRVRAESEDQACRRIGEELIGRANKLRNRHHLEMSVQCFDGKPRASGPLGTMAKIEMSRPSRGRVQGGRMT